MPEQFTSPSSRLVGAYRVRTAHEIFAWTETNTIIPDEEWPCDVIPALDNDQHFILAVPTPGGLVGFFAESAEQADRIEESVFGYDLDIEEQS